MSFLDMLMDPTLMLLGGLIVLMLLAGALGWMMRGEMDELDGEVRRNDEASQQLLARAYREVEERPRVRPHVRAKSEPLKPSYDSRRKS